MHARFFAQLGHDRGNALADDLLWIRLARIDDVIDDRSATEVGTRHFRLSLSVRLSRRHPRCVTIGVRSEWLVIEIEAELTQLPKLIRDVFARVRHSTIRAHYDLVRLMLVGAGVRLKRHDP